MRRWGYIFTFFNSVATKRRSPSGIEQFQNLDLKNLDVFTILP